MKLDFLGGAIFGGVLLIGLAVLITFISVGIFIIKALIKYIKAGDVRKEKSSIKKSLGESYSWFMRLLPPSYRMFQPPAELYDSMIFVADAKPTKIITEK